MNKKAIAAEKLIGVIILVVSFVVILFFLVQIFGSSPEQTIDKKVCHEAVVQRATWNIDGVIEPGRNLMNLQCKTEKICFTTDADPNFCEQQFGTRSSDNPFTIIKNPTKEEILKTFADAEYDCHWQLGEGQVNFMPRETFEKNYCVICSRISLNQQSYQLVKDTTQSEYQQYLHENKRDDKTYLEYIYGIKNPETIKLVTESIDGNQLTPELKQELEKLKEVVKKMDETKAFTQSNAIIASQANRGKIWQYVAAGGTTTGILVLTGAALTSTGLGSVIGVPILSIGIITAGVSGTTAYIQTAPSSDNTEYMRPTITSYPDGATQLNCDSFENIP